jgi:hypothetical protein
MLSPLDLLKQNVTKHLFRINNVINFPYRILLSQHIHHLRQRDAESLMELPLVLSCYSVAIPINFSAIWEKKRLHEANEITLKLATLKLYLRSTVEFHAQKQITTCPEKQFNYLYASSRKAASVHFVRAFHDEEDRRAFFGRLDPFRVTENGYS